MRHIVWSYCVVKISGDYTRNAASISDVLEGNDSSRDWNGPSQIVSTSLNASAQQSREREQAKMKSLSLHSYNKWIIIFLFSEHLFVQQL